MIHTAGRWAASRPDSRTSSRSSVLEPRALAAIAVLLACLTTAFGARAAGVYYVDGADPSCSNSGPGSSSTPYCTITAALNAVGGPGTTILVRPAVYREQVTVPASGSSGSPLVIQATGSPPVIDGSDDFSDPGAWSHYSGDVWRASGVTWSPGQVFADGARLTPSSDPPGSLAPQSFTSDAGGLYVNLGGDNPGLHVLLVGHRTYGFRLAGRSWITIDGCTVTRTEDIGIYLSDASSNVSILNGTVSYTNNFGIRAVGGSGLLIADNRISYNNDHGVYLSGGVTGSVIRGNETDHNARPEVRAANGIQLAGSSGNRIENNLVHDNQDTGVQINTDSNDNLSIQNRSWNNGDHGFDHLYSTGNVHIGDVAWGNYKEGFSVEGTSTGTQIYDCIGVDNGLTTSRFNLLVDSASIPGFVSDYNLFWNSTGTNRIHFGANSYTALASYVAASGQDVHSIEADPRFVSPAAGDFHLQSGSPAIDSGTSSPADWPATDAEGNGRVDDPGTPNTGAGPVPYADRGALEFGGSSTTPPTAVLEVTPASGEALLLVTADASGSTGGSGPIVSYTFDFDDGTVVGPQTSATALHAYLPGSYLVTVVVRDSGGGVALASAPVSVGQGAELCGNPSFETSIDGWIPGGPSVSLSRVQGGHDGNYSLEVGSTQQAEFGVDDSPNWVVSVPAAGTGYRFSAWVQQGVEKGDARLCVREFVGQQQQGSTVYSAKVKLNPSWRQLSVDYVARASGSTIDFQVLDKPKNRNATFLVDDVSIRIVEWVRPNTGVGDEPASGGIGLSAVVAPNPVSRSGRVLFTTSRAGAVKLEVFDLVGRRVSNPIDGFLAAGRHEASLFDAGFGAPSTGLYFYRLQAAEGTIQGRFVVLR